MKWQGIFNFAKILKTKMMKKILRIIGLCLLITGLQAQEVEEVVAAGRLSESDTHGQGAIGATVDRRRHRTRREAGDRSGHVPC